MAIGANTAALSKGALERLERARIVERYAFARTVARAIGWSIAACFAWLAIRELAGQQTSVTVSAALSVLAEAKIAVLISLAGATGVWAPLSSVDFGYARLNTFKIEILNLKRSLTLAAHHPALRRRAKRIRAIKGSERWLPVAA
jgi:hypothetical protein